MQARFITKDDEKHLQTHVKIASTHPSCRKSTSAAGTAGRGRSRFCGTPSRTCAVRTSTAYRTPCRSSSQCPGRDAQQTTYVTRSFRTEQFNEGNRGVPLAPARLRALLLALLTGAFMARHRASVQAAFQQLSADFSAREETRRAPSKRDGLWWWSQITGCKRDIREEPHLSAETLVAHSLGAGGARTGVAEQDALVATLGSELLAADLTARVCSAPLRRT